MLDPQDIRVTSYLPSSGHGAGGQMVGLTTSGVIVHHMPSGLGVSCDSERSQHANKEKALRLLEQLLNPETQPFCGDPHGDWFEQSSVVLETPPVTTADRVRMIKEVRMQVGCGLKEAKEAVDQFYDVEMAVLHLKINPAPMYPKSYDTWESPK